MASRYHDATIYLLTACTRSFGGYDHTLWKADTALASRWASPTPIGVALALFDIERIYTSPHKEVEADDDEIIATSVWLDDGELRVSNDKMSVMTTLYWWVVKDGVVLAKDFSTKEAYDLPDIVIDYYYDLAPPGEQLDILEQRDRKSARAKKAKKELRATLLKERDALTAQLAALQTRLDAL